MEFDTKTPLWSTADELSFAYPSARERWPVIVTAAIDDVHRSTAAASDAGVIEEGKRIVSDLAKLKYELQHGRQLTPLPDDGQPDIAGYNQELEQRGNPNWLDVAWLYSECYMYRRMNSLFSLSKHWKTYDIFARQKTASIRSSRPAILELAAKYKDIVAQIEKDKTAPPSESKSADEVEAAEKLLFIEMCEICLWGNATDLSLLTNLSYVDFQKLQGAEARKASEKNILVNDLPAAFAALRELQKEGKPERRVDFVLDNAGFELFVDLILAGYLLTSGLATTIVLHPKTIPWFVSDVVPADFSALLNALADPQTFYTSLSDDDKHAERTPKPLSDQEVDNVKFLFQQWSTFHAEGQLVLRPNTFWTEGGSFWRLPTSAPDLWDDLKKSELAIFKGDLNYRKLTGDAMWPATTPFSQALGPLGGSSGLRVLALRTCKGDVVVGLPEGRDEELRAMEGGGGDSGARKWAWTGKWAVVEFSDGVS
ncbi:DUF89-domain-containing protein [Rhizodiscina lignyota]|uniref:Sugar phosphate phosphatase n=1 Tax=Rhizodiscina lignyota TaxID=1504668 RepID=A0A9P4I6W3_9PEZI|nr:DUF89-domain-containing protein [Rhizodiscina lignyota]